MNVKFENYIRTTLTADLASASTIMTVASVSGWPSLPQAENYFYAVLIRLSDNRKEIVKVTTYSGTTATIVRGQDGTTALDLVQYDRVEIWVTAGALEDAFEEQQDDIETAQETADSAETIATDALNAANAAQTTANQALTLAQDALSETDGGTVEGDVVFNGEVTFNGAVSFEGTIDFTNATVTGLQAVPTGAYMEFPVENAPDGYLAADGSSVLKADYPALYEFLKDGGASCIYGETSTEFTLPDRRGRFGRGWDNGAGNDPDASSRTDRGDTLSGDHVGTLQEDEFEAHTHKICTRGYDNGSETGAYPCASPASNIGSTGGNETRPKNINVLVCIKT